MPNQNGAPRSIKVAASRAKRVRGGAYLSAQLRFASRCGHSAEIDIVDSMHCLSAGIAIEAVGVAMDIGQHAGWQFVQRADAALRMRR